MKRVMVRTRTLSFFFGGDEVFKPGLDKTVRNAYSQLFDEMGDDALAADKGDLTNWFRASDKTSSLVGQRQASTFQTLVALAGYGELPNTRAGGSKKAAATSPAAKASRPNKSTTSTRASEKAPPAKDKGDTTVGNASDVGLTVRIEVNLPPGGDAHTYDAIFASITEAPNVVSSPLERFERVARSVGDLVPPRTPTLTPTESADPHPFETRNIHPELPNKVRSLFDDGHWEQAVFEAFNYIEKEVKCISGLRGKTGYALMMGRVQ